MFDLATTLPPAPGVGYKSQHFTAIMADHGPVQWLEIHAENYMWVGARFSETVQSAIFPIEGG